MTPEDARQYVARKYPTPSPGSQRKDSDDWSLSGQNADDVSTRSASSQGFRQSEQAIDPQLDARLSQPQEAPRPFSPAIYVQRSLPSRDVDSDSIVDAYVDFIFYCNPAIPANTDTTELKKTFTSPPRSDGNSFSTFRLFELIRKFENKELKTWAQVAIELGVEPPALDKGQSAQKVQQYAVRLKRWMHAMHVDAFFEFLFNKPHIYWTQIPPPDESFLEHDRDGVVAEEDLAIRALIPETRPKRGRRKAEDREIDSEGRSPNPKRRQLSPTLSEDFEIARRTGREIYTPASAHPDIRRHDPWVESEPRVGFAAGPMVVFPNTSSRSSSRWRQLEAEQTPLSAYPHSAITPRSTNPFLDENEPRSAITPSRGRSRRRHGPAVSSAWSGSQSGGTGKLRGRPPSNRSITDGPFSTFPANPTSQPAPTSNTPVRTPIAAPLSIDIDRRHFVPPPAVTTPRRLNGLSLQVPERIGGTVRLATPPPPPPPTLLVNGAGTPDLDPSGEKTGSHVGEVPQQYDEDEVTKFPLPESQTDYIPMPKGISWEEHCGDDQTNVDEFIDIIVQDLLMAQWLDETGTLTHKGDAGEAIKLAKQIITDIHSQAACGQVYMINLAAMAGARYLRTKFCVTRKLADATSITYQVEWTLRLGPIQRNFHFLIATPRDTPKETSETAPVDETADAECNKTSAQDTNAQDDVRWKKKYMDLEARLKMQESKFIELQRSVVEAVAKSAKPQAKPDVATTEASKN